jgi:hypothetical protein
LFLIFEVLNIDKIYLSYKKYMPNVSRFSPRINCINSNAVKKNDIYFIGYRGKTFVGDYLWASENVNIINAFK